MYERFLKYMFKKCKEENREFAYRYGRQYSRVACERGESSTIKRLKKKSIYCILCTHYESATKEYYYDRFSSYEYTH